jgi:poly-gamma-glutamate synthesis protein (capsule biosynthesis protein)
MKLTIGGDFCITSSHLASNPFDKGIIELFEKSDFNIVNLECPVTEDDDENKIIKTGPHLRTSDEIFDHLKCLNTHAVTLANNHILDYGEEGLQQTVDCCIKNNIAYVGAGVDLEVAAEPLIIEKEGLNIAFVNFCENEWSIATSTKGGANPIDTIDNLKQIKNAKEKADFVIVIIHGGHEYYNLPSPRMVKQYRFFAENGADAIIGHHTHCISGFEVYKNVPIFYSLGNMIFTINNNNPEWYTGLIAQLHIEKGEPIQWELIPICQTDNEFKLVIPENEIKNQIIERVNIFSGIISDETKLNSNWDDFVLKMETQYINTFSPINLFPGRYFRAILKRLGVNKFIFRKRYVTPIVNYLQCESHFDLSKTILKRIIYKI